jgi:hypothetical protein
MPFFCARDTISSWFRLFEIDDIYNQRKHLIIFLLNFRTAHCSFHVGPIMIVDEPFTVGFSLIGYLYMIDKISCLELDNIYFFGSDWQWSDDSHHENKKGQSDRQVQKGDRSEIWGARACALIADLIIKLRDAYHLIETSSFWINDE